jgi:hypothetical protein
MNVDDFYTPLSNKHFTTFRGRGLARSKENETCHGARTAPDEIPAIWHGETLL